MGCTFSSRDDDDDKPKKVGADFHGSGGDTFHNDHAVPPQSSPREITEAALPPPRLDEHGNLTPEEVQKRIVDIKRPMTAILGKGVDETDFLEVKCAFLTQRGWYPKDPHKKNQDAFSINTDFLGEEGDALFIVYDGHGPKGDICARYAMDHLPSLISKFAKQAMKDRGKGKGKGGGKEENGGIIPIEQFEKAIEKAHVRCNENMHNDNSIDDSVSGTTAISAAFNGCRVTVSCVGDSRCIVGCKLDADNNGDADADADIYAQKNGLIAVPLSRDQIPYRRDERERVRAAGARVMSMGQIEGREPVHENWGDVELGQHIDEGGDPPRLWVKGWDYPGCEFTRSLGDEVAEGIGVFAVPEFNTREISENDKILVLASDGVFEFLTNQEVIDICARCSDPLDACRKVVRKAYDQWVEHEGRTDDITIIVMFLDSDKEAPKDPRFRSELLALSQRKSDKPLRRQKPDSVFMVKDADGNFRKSAL